MFINIYFYTLKDKETLDRLDPRSKSIFTQDLITQYTLRPDELEECCLADFASEYNIISKINIVRNEDQEINDDDEDDSENSDIHEKKIMQLKDNSKSIVKCKTSKIIRFLNVSFALDDLNYYREQLMLFLPWKNEATELLHIDYKSKFESNLDKIMVNKK